MTINFVVPWNIIVIKLTPSSWNKLSNRLNGSLRRLPDFVTDGRSATVQGCYELHDIAQHNETSTIQWHQNLYKKWWTQTSSTVKRAQMDETILLKTSDGSIEASWKLVQRNLTPWVWSITKRKVKNLEPNHEFLHFSKWQWHPQGKTRLYKILQNPTHLRVLLLEGKEKCWRTGQESNKNNSMRNH